MDSLAEYRRENNGSRNASFELLLLSLDETSRKNERERFKKEKLEMVQMEHENREGLMV